MKDWISRVKKELREYNDLAYNVYNMLKEYYTYEEIRWMPLKNVQEIVNEFKPRFKEIQKRRQDEEMKQRLQLEREARAQKANSKRKRRKG